MDADGIKDGDRLQQPVPGANAMGEEGSYGRSGGLGGSREELQVHT